MNVAITFNVKPEEESITEPPSSKEELPSEQQSVLPQISTLYNDVYAEWDSSETIEAVRGALAFYHNVTLVEANDTAFDKLKKLRPDIVFNIAEGINGISREAQIPAMLDMLNIPYTGSDPLTLATCLDKARTKEILSYYDIKNPRFITASDPDELKEFPLRFPVMIKPVAEGSSKGIFNSSFINNYEELKEAVAVNGRTYGQPSLIEEFLPGREFTVAIIGNGSNACALPIVEINFSELPGGMAPIYSYEAKWIVDRRENPLEIFTCPAYLEGGLEDKIKSAALRTYKTLRCKDWSRIDIRLDEEGEPNIIEVNPLPGILPDPKDNSCFPKAARAAGLDYQQMINQVLYVSAKRHNLI
ncbi:MAG: ATP-grasp domain-containing protein [Ignavibacteria bacterium]|nr:ATP-grasp domain-containing protein [Ignavibacteria bacterium]MCU7502044.1 ATP-grasp domain-containing protein [Ignavibacteria bacterium]MCU7515446.1 ATP-grasp domain-containing protein [Ignavibacteria bacterium]